MPPVRGDLRVVPPSISGVTIAATAMAASSIAGDVQNSPRPKPPLGAGSTLATTAGHARRPKTSASSDGPNRP